MLKFIIVDLRSDLIEIRCFVKISKIICWSCWSSAAVKQIRHKRKDVFRKYPN